MLGALLAAPLASHAQNLVTNGDFEARNAGWTISAGASYTTAMRAYPSMPWLKAYDGNYYANFGEVGAPGSMSQSITTVSGYHYRFTFYLYRAQEGFNANAGDFFTAAVGGNTLFSTSGMAYGLPYKRYSYVFQASGASTLVEFTGQDNQDEYVLDAVSVTRLTADATNTLTALSWDRANLRALLKQRGFMLLSVLDYDCGRIRENVCVTLQARATTGQVNSDGAGVVVAAFQPRDGLRLGAFLDQQMRNSTGHRMTEDAPRPGFGFFAVMGRDDEPGWWHARASAAMRSGGLTLTRDASLAYTDPGSGHAALRERAGQLEISYSLRSGSVMWSPLIGFTALRAERAAYRETDDVFAPISYAKFSRDSRRLRFGMRGEGSVTERLHWRALLAGERDLAGRLGAFSGTSDIPGLQSFSFASEALPRDWRPLGVIGFDYRLGAQIGFTTTLSHRGGPYGATSLMAGLRLDL